MIIDPAFARGLTRLVRLPWSSRASAKLSLLRARRRYGAEIADKEEGSDQCGYLPPVS